MNPDRSGLIQTAPAWRISPIQRAQSVSSHTGMRPRGDCTRPDGSAIFRKLEEAQRKGGAGVILGLHRPSRTVKESWRKRNMSRIFQESPPLRPPPQSIRQNPWKPTKATNRNRHGKCPRISTEKWRRSSTENRQHWQPSIPQILQIIIIIIIIIMMIVIIKSKTIETKESTKNPFQSTNQFFHFQSEPTEKKTI